MYMLPKFVKKKVSFISIDSSKNFLSDCTSNKKTGLERQSRAFPGMVGRRYLVWPVYSLDVDQFF